MLCSPLAIPSSSSPSGAGHPGDPLCLWNQAFIYWNFRKLSWFLVPLDGVSAVDEMDCWREGWMSIVCIAIFIASLGSLTRQSRCQHRHQSILKDLTRRQSSFLNIASPIGRRTLTTCSPQKCVACSMTGPMSTRLSTMPAWQ